VGPVAYGAKRNIGFEISIGSFDEYPASRGSAISDFGHSLVLAILNDHAHLSKREVLPDAVQQT
jgi:hypothetical protein